MTMALADLIEKTIEPAIADHKIALAPDKPAVRLTSLFLPSAIGKDGKPSLTTNAAKPITGWAMISPPAMYAGKLGYEAFLEQVMFRRLHFSPFHVDHKTGALRRGSLISYPVVDLVCSACGHTPEFSPRQFRTQRRKATCSACFSGEMNLVTAQVPRDPERPGFKAMYEAYSEGAADPESLWPRVWAIYDRGRAPSEFAPKDELAREIEIRAARKGWTIRPLTDARASGAEPQHGLAVETGLTRVGWMSEQQAYGGESADYGYTVRIFKPSADDKAL